MTSDSKGKLAVLDTEGHEASDCQHHWVIESPPGPTSKGVRRNCGDERDSQNYVEGSSWHNDASLKQLAGGPRVPGVKAPNSRRNTDEEDA